MNGTLKRKRYDGTLTRNQRQSGWSAVARGAHTILQNAETLSTGFDLLKKATGRGGKTKTETKSTKIGQKQLALGWYVDFMTGLQYSWKPIQSALKLTQGNTKSSQQNGLLTLSTLNRAAEATLVNSWDLALIQAVTNTGSRTIIQGTQTKIMFTNMSNVKWCYEFYYVTPRESQATTFLSQTSTVMNTLDAGFGINDKLTSWTPQSTPGLLKGWKILSKSVFRLSPGETGEIHIKDKINQIAETMERSLGRTYIPKFNTQLYVRYYGCPTAQSIIGMAAPFGNLAAFGDDVCTTSYIIEKTYKYTLSDIATPDAWIMSTDVSALVAGNEIVTQVETDNDITPAQ